jgi:DNA-binding winged helix-turn-helix (wHTH) protein
MKVRRNLQKKSKENPTTVSATTAHALNHVYHFGAFCLNETQQQLLYKGQPVHLAPKAFELLLVLVQNKGCLVTKERLLEEIWPDVFVQEANLSVNIASLRKAFDESNAEGKWIETVSKRGYRFVAPVSEVVYEGDGKRDSVAVLPFENEGCGAVGEYLSTGLMESITNSLSKWSDIRVMAPHRVYARHRPNVDPHVIGHELGVRSVLMGRILELGNDLIVRTDLVDVPNGWQLWGEQYHTRLSDILIVQQELTAKISENLRSRLRANCICQSASLKRW